MTRPNPRHSPLLPSLRERSSDAETIASIDRQLRDGFPLLTFGPALERRYVSDNFAAHKRFLIRVAALALVLYDLFLLNDRLVMPDIFVEAVISRLAVFTPLALITIYVSTKTTSPRILESTFCAMSVVSLILTLSLAVQSASPDRTVCVYGAMLVMMFSSVVHRLRFRYAVAAIAGMLGAVCAAMLRLGMFDGEMLAGNMSLFGPAALLLIAASYALEREERLGYLVSLRSELLNQQLDLSSSLDPLTNLWDRRVLTAAMESAWSAAAAAPSVMGVIIADVDRFKLFNDSYGHLEGDLCLQRVAASLRTALGEGAEVLVRFGGEEFVVFCPGLGGPAATDLAERLRAAVRSLAIPHPVLGPDEMVTASFGVAAAAAPAITPAALMESADTALYEAKRSGRDCVRQARPEGPSSAAPDRMGRPGRSAEPSTLAAPASAVA